MPIPGTRSADRAAENVGAADLVLSADDVAAIAQILPAGGYGLLYADGQGPDWV